MSIRAKIILSFGFLFFAAFALMWGVARRLLSDAVEAQFAAQAVNVGRLLERGAPINDASLASLQRVFGADVALLDDLGRWWGTLPKEAQADLEARRRAGMPGAPEAAGTFGDPGSAGRVIPCRLAGAGDTFAVHVPFRPRRVEGGWAGDAPAPREGALYLFYPAERVASEMNRARGPLLAVMAGGLALVAVLGIVVALTITRPIERLAVRTREVAAGHLSLQSPVPGPGSAAPHPDRGRGAGDEIAQLSASFDRMVDGLRRSQEGLLRHEKLAVTGRIAAGIAHEIRNPLQAMRMTVQLLAREERDGERRRALDLLLGEIGRLEFAVTELMELANPSPPLRAPVDLKAVVGDVLALVEAQAAHQGVALVRDLAPVPALAADPARLRRVIMNLVLNAIQAMPVRGTLTVRTSPGTSDIGPRRAVRLEVIDTGPGIPPELRDTVFEPFVTGKPGGNGLGLATVKRIVEEHGGRVGFETGGSGTRFWVELGAGNECPGVTPGPTMPPRPGG